MPEQESSEMQNATASNILENQPDYVNYARVAMDVIMTILLIFVVAADVGTSATKPGKSLHVHEMPIYMKKPMNFGDLWKNAQDDKLLATDVAKVISFKKKIAIECEDIHKHPMCTCIAASGSSPTVAKNCLLQKPQPSVTSDWNIGTISSSMILWFVASLATSVGTLPYIQTYVAFVHKDQRHKTIIAYNKLLVAVYCFITLSAFVAPFITTATQFPGSQAHMDSLFNMMIFSGTALVAIVAYNFRTLQRFMHYASVDTKTEPTTAKVVVSWQHTSVNNFILYMHLIISAPAIAMILHLTQQWTEYSTIVNTTLVLSTIFAVDAFSAEMANYWAHHATIKSHHHHGKTDSDEQSVKNLHTRLGLMRLFAWVINLVMLVLLFTLAYPIEVEQQKTNSAIFVVIVVAYGAVFLAPDLVREFTDRVSFNSIQFRLYGDFIVRAMALFFVWRASVSERA